MTSMRSSEKCCALLVVLAITATLDRVLCAVALAMEDETRLTEVTKRLYPVTAERTGSKPENVERNLRTAVLRAWRVNRPLLDQMAKYHLMAPPCVSGFIDIVATYIQRDLLGPASAKL